MMKIEIVEINTPPSLQFWSGPPESSFVAFYDGIVSNAVIFLPGVVDMKTSGARSKSELVEKESPHVAFYHGSATRAPAILPGIRHLKPQPLRHVQLVGFINMESPHMTYNEEILSMARTLVLDYKDFLADQLSSLLNLALLKREQSLSTSYNQAMLATLNPGEVESQVTPPSNSRYLTGLKKGLPFVAFYDGIAAAAVIFLPGAVEQINTSTPRNRVAPFVAFYDGMVATAQIFLPGAVEQAYALISSHGNKVGLMRHPDVALYKGIRALVHALMPGNVQQLKPQPLRHVQLVGFINMESPHITYNEEILSMARTLVLDYNDFLEGQLSSLLNLTLLKREQSLSTAYNQAMLATLDPGEAESQVTPPSNSRYLARLPFIAFYDGVAATAVVFLPGHLKTMESAPSTPRYATRMETGPSHDNVYNYGILTKARVFLPFAQKERPPEVEPSNPRPLVRPQWSRVEKYRLLKDKLDGLPLRYKPRSTKYITFKEKEMDTRRRILNTIPSLKPVPPGSCLARSPLTPWYWLEDTHPEMVSATLKDLASQHMKYFRASPSRAPGQQAGRSQIQIMEDLYWEELRTRGAPGTTEEMYSRLRQEMSFTRKLWNRYDIKETNLQSDQKGKSIFNTKTALLNDTACLNTNNNGYTKEEGDCDLDAANSSVFGSKSDQVFSRGQDLARKKPRHSYLNKRHSDGFRSLPQQGRKASTKRRRQNIHSD
ncbi:uncharacterized protein LOC125371688 [Haliotis rufescens]|uniref:uncharacterized protein LOC125371688 n=1 Tax=Haliotis rufescens TaxID=6454 RepID=UPI00201F989F|nr:uncharacterized protein LOC125371688 [Haliotis rufescens]